MLTIPKGAPHFDVLGATPHIVSRYAQGRSAPKANNVRSGTCVADAPLRFSLWRAGATPHIVYRDAFKKEPRPRSTM